MSDAELYGPDLRREALRADRIPVGGGFDGPVVRQRRLGTHGDRARQGRQGVCPDAEKLCGGTVVYGCEAHQKYLVVGRDLRGILLTFVFGLHKRRIEAELQLIVMIPVETQVEKTRRRAVVRKLDRRRKQIFGREPQHQAPLRALRQRIEVDTQFLQLRAWNLNLVVFHLFQFGRVHDVLVIRLPALLALRIADELAQRCDDLADGKDGHFQKLKLDRIVLLGFETSDESRHGIAAPERIERRTVLRKRLHGMHLSAIPFGHQLGNGLYLAAVRIAHEKRFPVVVFLFLTLGRIYIFFCCHNTVF